ncbi:type 1 glutamine amidotransferase [Nereida sp. MMG025]|uniref:type 1 glutamine amidotransferase n=1 Tax=Nereida sp. MMG025 TaxID=2909981 RepID=UPI001F3F03F2|nr:type 1 glutamine amidotransferase [Nereida sp. MMG025]MCF6443841.1 type 1 glutamine amidotransferase [Nereida sp. MMG025]
MKIGILQCGHTPDEVKASHGDFDLLFHQMFEGQNFTFQTWNVVDMAFPRSPKSADGWLVTGSKHGAYEDHAFIPKLEELIRRIYDADRPMVGICFGHQIIAQALGGTVEKFTGGWAIGRHDYEMEGLGRVAVNAWHQDQVVTVPADARVIGSSPFCRNAALVYGDKVMTVQPHPELTNPVIGSYIENRRGTADYPEDLMDQAQAAVSLPNEGDKVAQALADFLKRGAP